MLGAPVIPSATLGLWTHAHFALGLFLARSVGHVHKRVTDHLNVVYYVADTFSQEYTGSSLKMVERNVDALCLEGSILISALTPLETGLPALEAWTLVARLLFPGETVGSVRASC